MGIIPGRHVNESRKSWYYRAVMENAHATYRHGDAIPHEYGDGGMDVRLLTPAHDVCISAWGIMGPSWLLQLG